MEQQTVSITKAGIIATLNARTSILASANPVNSRYNAKLSVVENIKLPPTLLSRFDLIYLILDKPNVDSDRQLAKHLVSLYYQDDDDDDHSGGDPNNIRRSTAQSVLPPVDQTFLKEYILFARNNIYPEITVEAEELLVRNYVEMRSLGRYLSIYLISIILFILLLTIIIIIIIHHHYHHNPRHHHHFHPRHHHHQCP